jgi:hypothetical protein
LDNQLKVAILHVQGSSLFDVHHVIARLVGRGQSSPLRTVVVAYSTYSIYLAHSIMDSANLSSMYYAKHARATKDMANRKALVDVILWETSTEQRQKVLQIRSKAKA